MGKNRGSSSETLDAARRLIEVYGCLHQEVIRQGGKEQDLYRICADRKLRQDLALRILGQQTLEGGIVSEGAFRIFMDYDTPFPQRVKSACFDYANPGYEHCTFAAAGHGRTRLAVGFMTFTDYTDTERVLKAIEAADGRRPATPEVLLTFATSHPDMQRSFRIVAIGTVIDVDGENLFPGLWGTSTKRNLQLHRVSEDWAPNTRFLVIEKPKGA